MGVSVMTVDNVMTIELTITNDDLEKLVGKPVRLNFGDYTIDDFHLCEQDFRDEIEIKVRDAVEKRIVEMFGKESIVRMRHLSPTVMHGNNLNKNLSDLPIDMVTATEVEFKPGKSIFSLSKGNVTVKTEL